MYRIENIAPHVERLIIDNGLTLELTYSYESSGLSNCVVKLIIHNSTMDTMTIEKPVSRESARRLALQNAEQVLESQSRQYTDWLKTIRKI